MKILIACEYSGIVRDAFTQKGWDAWSCDLLPTETPGNHYTGDVRDILNECYWDMVIAFPPCTNLAVSGALWFWKKQRDGLQQPSIDFFMTFANLPLIKHVAIENPIGIMSTLWRKPDQIIQPYDFGNDASKRTCLWLKNLPHLIPTQHVAPRLVTNRHGKVAKRWANQCDNYGHDKTGPSKLRGKLRSATYSGIATAMADQWTKYFSLTVDNSQSVV